MKATKRNLIAVGATSSVMVIGGIAIASTGIGSIALGTFGFAAEGAIAEAVTYGCLGVSMTVSGGIVGCTIESEYTQYKEAVEKLKQYINDKEAQKADAKYKKPAIGL